MADTRETVSMLGWGAVAGALPTVGKIAGTFGANFAAPSPAWSGVLIAIGLYAGIGSVVARAMDNPEMKQALFAGIAAPAIVVSVVAGVTDSRTVNPALAPTRTGFFISSAFADPTALP